MLFTVTSKIAAKSGDVIDVTAHADAQTYRLRVALIDTIDRFPVVTGRMVDHHGRTTDEIRTVVLNESNSYALVPGRPTFAEIALRRIGQHRPA